MILSDDGKKTFILTPYKNEDELEKIVIENYQQIYGEYSIFIPKMKLKTSGGFGTIPDGFVIDFEESKWFIVEVELAKHGTWNHIAPQISKQITAVCNKNNTKNLLIPVILDMIQNDSGIKGMINNLGIKDIQIQGKIDKILDNDPTISVPIDEIPDDFETWLGSLKYNGDIWVIEKYVNIDDEMEILLKFPCELTPSISSTPSSGVTISSNKIRSTTLINELITKNKLTIGEELILSYKPKGKGKPHIFKGKITQSYNIEIDGNEYSPSAGAMYCYGKVGSSRLTENGLRKWKTKKGKSLLELREEL